MADYWQVADRSRVEVAEPTQRLGPGQGRKPPAQGEGVTSPDHDANRGSETVSDGLRRRRWTPKCMSAEEYALWQAANERIRPLNGQARTPCWDCPLAFWLENRAAGTCNPLGGRRHPGWNT
jgi:hypothetical protein